MKRQCFSYHFLGLFDAKSYNKRLMSYKKCIIFIYIKDFSADNFGGTKEIVYFCKEMKKSESIMKTMKRYFTLILLIVILIPNSVFAYKDWEPKADESAIVTSGNMRFTVLTPQMIRIQWSATKNFEERATFAVVNRRLPVPAFTTETSGGYLYIRTSDLELRYRLTSTPKASDKKPDNLQITMKLNGQDVVWYPGKDDALNLLGTTRTLDRVWGESQRNILEKGILSRAGWSIIDESPQTKRGDGSTTFAMEDTEDGFPWWKQPVDKNAIDWYFMGYGHDYKKALTDFTRIAGSVPLPPKYIFGYWYSRYWGYSQSDFINLVSQAEQNELPMDVMIMDMDWHKSGWTGWSWNKSLIPNPTTLINYMHAHGLKTALNLHPSDGVANYEDNYSKLRSDLGLPNTYTAPVLWKIEDYDFYKAFFKNIMRLRESEGVDFWWQDWQQALTVAKHGQEKNYTPAEGAGNLSETFWINHVYFTDMEKYRQERPVIYHRWGGLGSHRYPICFSGDTFAAWSTLAYEIPFTSMASNVCYAYWGHDLGGHQGGNNDPELMQRWLQFGVFTPIFRTHATNDGKLERRLWKYSNYKQLLETVRLRYKLFPYIYTCARETYDTGIGMNRPLYYDYPEDNNAYVRESEYMFGGDILVAPIATPSVDGYSEREIWLPKGQWWDVTKNELKEGNRILTDQFTTDEIPYYYRAGAIIPQYPVQRTVQTTPETIILQVVPGANGTGRFYEDAGDNKDYTEGQFANTTFSQARTAKGITLQIAAREGSYPGIPEERAWRVEVLGMKQAPAAITVNGTATTDYEYDETRRLLIVNVAKTSCSKAQSIVIEGDIDDTPVVAGRADTFPETDPYTADPVSKQLYISGSAVPGGQAMLEAFPDGSFKYHGHLLNGDLYIMDKAKVGATTKFCKPSVVDANIVTDGTPFTSAYNNSNATWHVTFEADNYRFTVNPNTNTVKGELFLPWAECFIMGGCTNPGQEKWDWSKGLAMERSKTDPNEWTWTGKLAAYPGNTEPKRLKIYGQYDWGPNTLSPYSQDASLLSATRVITNNSNDFKWQIGEDGYYRIRINAFRETISAEYFGKELPVGIEATPALPQRGGDTGVYDLSGRKVGDNSQFTIHNSQLKPGVYIVNGKKIVK